MASVNTNFAAITALRTLQTTNTQLDATQNRISTGYKIGEAKDNAAYWAISTTLKSDNKSLGTVKDALGLGASTVDTAYQGLNKAKDVLDEIKSKLTAATQDGVNRDTIQNEIKQLQDQLKSIATSSVFSGENWLSVDTSAVSYNATKSVVASFSRDGNGAVSIGTIAVDITDVALFDSSTAYGSGGIMDGAVNLKGKDGRDLTIGGTDVTTGNAVKAGLTETSAAGVTGAAYVAGTAVTATALGATAGPGSKSKATYATGTGLAVAGNYAAGDTITVTFSNSKTLTLTAAAGNLTELNSGTVSWATLAGGTLSATPGFGVTGSASGLVIENTAVGTTAAPTITSIAAVTADTTDTEAATLPAAPTTVNGTAAVASSSAASVKSTALTLGNFAVGDKVSVTLDVNGTATTYTTEALTKAGGALAFSDIVSALNSKLGSVATASVNGSSELVLTAGAVGAKTVFSLNKLTAVDSTGAGKTLAGGIGTEPTLAKFETGSFTAVTLDKDDNLYFNVQVDKATAAKNITIDQALINKTLSTDSAPVTDGSITSAADFKKVVEAALKAANVTSLDVTVTNTDKLTFTSKVAGTDSKIIISDVEASKGGDTITVDTIDISDAAFATFTSDEVKEVLSAYIDVVNAAITKVTDAAASLGSVAARVDLQKGFVDTLMDTIDKGVGNLIDADMSEESTKLQALQVKQQLGVQALSIANQSSQNILALFQG